MKFVTFFVVSTFALTALTSCGKTYTADYLLTDKAKRQEILADCKVNNQSTENCKSANQAQSAIYMQIQTKAMRLETLKIRQNTADNSRRMFGSSPRYEAETKARQEQMQKLTAEMEALAKQ